MTEPETTPNQHDDGVDDVAEPELAPSELAHTGPDHVAEPELAPSDLAPSDLAPSDLAPSDLAPSDLAPSDLAPSDAAPSDPAQPDVRLLEVGSDIGWPETDAETATRARFAATPAGVAGLGRLADLAIWLSGVQRVCPPQEPRRARLIVFADAEAAAKRAASGSNDGADAAAVCAAAADVGLRVVTVNTDGDTDTDTDTHPEAGADPDAATRAAIAVGIRAADDEIDAGADLLAVGALGSGSATAAAVVVSVMMLVEPIKVVGGSSPLGDQAWMHQVAEIRDTRLRALPHRHDVEALLATVGGTDLAAITGFLVRAAVRRTPVILDGTIVGAAALLAREISPNAVRWWQCGERGTDPANLLAVAEFSAVPLLDLGLAVGDGVGAALAVPLVRAAARAANELAVGT